MKNTTETITESMKSAIDFQSKLVENFFGASTSLKNPFENLPNPNEIYENTVKFHTACIQYHNSILNVLDAMNSLNPNKKKTNK